MLVVILTAKGVFLYDEQGNEFIAFTNGYHGLTMGALAVTGNDFYRDESCGARNNADSMIIAEETLSKGMAIVDRVVGELLAQKEAARSGDTAA